MFVSGVEGFVTGSGGFRHIPPSWDFDVGQKWDGFLPFCEVFFDVLGKFCVPCFAGGGGSLEDAAANEDEGGYQAGRIVDVGLDADEVSGGFDVSVDLFL